MKTKILLFCVMLGTIFVSISHSMAAYNDASSTNSSREIPLQGCVERPGQMRSDIISMAANMPPITAEQQSDVIFAHFHRDIGVVQVTITNEFGTVEFTAIIDSATQPILAISLMGLPPGSYVITFNSENGELSGKFVL